MTRVGAIFVALCMLLIAGSLGSLLYLYMGMTLAESAIVALTALTGLAVYNAAAGRQRERENLSTQVGELSHGIAELARQVLDLGRRIAAAESKAAGAADKALVAMRPLSAEIGELGALVRQLAEAVAAHDALLADSVEPAHRPVSAASAPALDRIRAGVAALDAGSGRERAGGSPAPSSHAEGGRFAGMERDAVVAMLRSAVDAGRLDLHLQPIVTLPQRKVRYYEALVRLRSPEGEVLLPADFIPYAESGGLMPQIDNAMLFRCVQAVRRLASKNREVGLFCNLAGSTLSDPELFPQMSEFLEANRAIAPALVFEFKQSALRAMGPIENEALAALAARGFRFSLDQVGDLRFEPRDLAERGFRYVKVPASLLLARNAELATDIHPADVAGLLSRFGIELIAEKIEAESTVVDLLDYDVKLGQGHLFSPPRPVRPEILGAAERSEPAPTPAAEPRRPAAADASPPSGPRLTPADSPRTSAFARLARSVVART